MISLRRTIDYDSTAWAELDCIRAQVLKRNFSELCIKPVDICWTGHIFRNKAWFYFEQIKGIQTVIAVHRRTQNPAKHLRWNF